MIELDSLDAPLLNHARATAQDRQIVALGIDLEEINLWGSGARAEGIERRQLDHLRRVLLLIIAAGAAPVMQ